MESHLKALFENAGLINNGKLLTQNIKRINVAKIIDVCNQSSDITSHDNIDIIPSVFSYAASSSIGGDKEPCSGSPCRINKVKELSQFAALYSDKVYIRNFFYDYADASPKSTSEKEDIKMSFHNDMMVFRELLPLIEEGKVQMVTFRDICPHCLSLGKFQQSMKAEYDNASKKLEKRYYDEVNYSIYYDHEYDEFSVIARGPDLLIPSHGKSIYVYRDKRELLSIAPELARIAMASGEVRLTKAQSKKVKAGERICNPIINSITFQLGAARELRASILSDSDIETTFISNLTTNALERRRASLMERYLTCFIPFLECVDTSKIIELRKKEPEAFISFRAALTEAINEYKTIDGRFTEKDAQAIYADIIHPRLAVLDARIKKANDDFSKGTMRKLLGWTGAISIGIYTGILTANPLAGAAAIGAATVTASIIENTMAKSDTKEDIKDDELYFLWRVKESAKIMPTTKKFSSHLIEHNLRW